jgi:hypothetical protein
VGTKELNESERSSRQNNGGLKKQISWKNEWKKIASSPAYRCKSKLIFVELSSKIDRDKSASWTDISRGRCFSKALVYRVPDDENKADQKKIMYDKP